MKWNIIDIKNLVEENGYIFIDSYISNKEKRIVMQDNIGYKYDVLLCHFVKGHRGFLVVGKYNPFSVENMKLWLSINKENIVLYSDFDYKRNSAKIIFTCLACGSQFQSSWNTIRNKIACPECMKKIIGEKNKTHGKTGTKLYIAWSRMKSRCYNIGDPHHYKYYISKGIVVCDEWHLYENFEKWAMSNGYDEGLTIERIDPTKSYSPENCCWIESKFQNRNRTNSVAITINGETKTFGEWQSLTGVKESTIRMRMKRGYFGEDLIYKGTLRRKIEKLDD